MISEYVFLILIFMVAFLYSSVGHGGASGYLALMAFFSYSQEFMRTTALLLNILVSAIAFFQFHQKKYFQWNLFWPFAILSVPAAFIGGMMDIDENVYKKILAVLLLLSVIRLTVVKQDDEVIKKQNRLASIFIGLIIGLFSGMIGIGGGIILSPVILLLNWAGMKQTAAVSALFIMVNSIAGLAGVITKGLSISSSAGVMLIIALAGGLAGSYAGAMKFNTRKLRYLLSVVLVIAAFKLIFA